ncbi:MAG: hypothetical protein WD601_08775, partial [Pseudohongiellaceae bacterium]
MSGTQQPVKAWASMAVVAGIAVFMFIIASAWRAGSVDTEGLVLEGSLARQGLDVATGYGCVACHTLDGSPGIGPT